MAMSEEQKKENAKIMTSYVSIVLGILGGYVVAYANGVTAEEHLNFIDGLIKAISRISAGRLLFPLRISSVFGFLFGGVIIGSLAYFFMSLDDMKNYHYTEDAVAGTGGFMSKKEMEAYAEKHIKPDPYPIVNGLPVAYDPENDKKMYSQNMIMSDFFCRPMNSRALIGNNNIMLVGAAGTGKSRFFMKPNILQMNGSFVITDPSGELVYSLGKVLKDHGYKIKIFNISDMAHSNCYNPFAYIRDEAGVKMLIECLINNTTKGEGGGDNQFFVDAEQLLYSACIFYLKDFCFDDSKKNFAGVMSMINASSIDENNSSAESPLDKLFNALPQDSLAWKYYKAFKQAAGKTLKSIVISCVTRLQPFLIPQVINLTKRDDLHLEKLGEEKTALFIITPQADRTYSFLASMLYSQAFETLYYVAEKQKAEIGNEMLNIPVRFLLDEFANIGKIPEFPSKLATMRKYNISATIALQNISQIEAMYEDDWKTLVGNCSTIVFLGSQEPEVLKYFSEMLGKTTIRVRSDGTSSSGKGGGSSKNFQSTGREVLTAEELGRLPSDECIIFTQNHRAVRDKKYRYERHPYYPQTADADKELGFRYQDMLMYNNQRLGHIDSVLKARMEAQRYRKKMTEEHDARDPEKIKADQSGDVLNNINLGEAEMRKVRQDALANAIKAAAANGKSPLCMISLDNVPTNLLPGIAKQVSAALQLDWLCIFSTSIFVQKDSDTEMYVGVATDFKHRGLANIMNNEYSVSTGTNGGYIHVVVRTNRYKEFCEYAKTKAAEKISSHSAS